MREVIGEDDLEAQGLLLQAEVRQGDSEEEVDNALVEVEGVCLPSNPRAVKALVLLENSSKCRLT